jgi:hypothetical protein
VIQKVEEFLNAIKNNNKESFMNCISEKKIDSIKDLIGYYGSAGIETTTSYIEYILITIDALNENLFEYFGDDCFEKFKISLIENDGESFVVRLETDLDKRNITVIKENDCLKIGDFGTIED